MRSWVDMNFSLALQRVGHAYWHSDGVDEMFLSSGIIEVDLDPRRIS